MRRVLLASLLLALPACEGAITRDHAMPPVPPVPSDGGAWRPPSPVDGGPGVSLMPGYDAGPGTPPPPPPQLDAGGPPPVEDDALGPCSGTEAECFAAEVINEYRTSHMHQGECNNALRWNDNLGRLAHEHQSGPFVRHSSHGYVENVGQAYGVRETAEYIVSWEAGIEEHCRSDGSYTVSHHCASMFCNNFTIGVGVYENGGTTYMTMMFGDESGNPSW
ncbi:MAG: hypothetical protein H6719_33715 [Sandaracinaceae bacterium]|nr:hypothetical protein [Sandaracinaceae bacterium]